MKTSVAVIGAGAAGIAALRQLSQQQDVFDAVCFEKADVVGGLWVYSDKVKDENENPVHSALYKNLTVNIPKQVIGFEDLGFSDDLPDYFSHTHMRQYLEDYVDHFDLRKYIQLNMKVERVCPLPEKEGLPKWQVTVGQRDSSEPKSETHVFDAILICVGQESAAYIPTIPGMENFKGRMLHSHDYRRPEDFSGSKRILFNGCGLSGMDIALDLAAHVDEMLLSVYDLQHFPSTIPNNARCVAKVKEIKADSVVFEDGEEVEVDVIMFSSGYNYSFPFLTPECHVQVEHGRVSHVWMQCIHTEYPNFVFIGLQKWGHPFRIFSLQTKLFLAALTARIQLPSQEQMERDEAEEDEVRRSQKMRPEHKHRMIAEIHPKNIACVWEYDKEVSRILGIEPTPHMIRELTKHCYLEFMYNYAHFKEYSYEILDQDTFRATRVYTINKNP